MPEILPPGVLTKIDAIKSQDPNRYRAFPGWIKGKVEAEQLDYLGHGHESIVIQNPHKSDRVIAFNYREMPPEKAKRIYYMQRVYAVLFPHNFPHFYASQGGANSVTHRHEIAAPSSAIKYPFSEVDKICEQWNIPQPWLLDPSRGNYMVGADGGEYWCDQLRTPDNLAELNKALRYMDARGKYSDREKRTVQRSIDRIIAIDREHETRLAKENPSMHLRLIIRLMKVLNIKNTA